MLRIEPVESADTVVLRVEGRIIGAWVDELREACDAALARRAGVIVDLEGVWFVDREGLALLEQLRHREVTLSSGSSLVSEQLKAWTS